jgi:hypothetical protein
MQTIATIDFRLPPGLAVRCCPSSCSTLSDMSALGHSAPWIATDLFRHAELRRYTAIYWEAV